MPRTEASRLTSVRTALGILTGLAVGYLAVVAAWPGVQRSLPPALAWFGRPNSAVSIGLVTLLIVLFAAMLARGGSAAGAPVAIVAGLASISAVLGVASYWRCQDDSHPDFFTPLVWTAQLVKGGNPVGDLDAGACPSPVPVALNIAQLSALAAVFLSVVGVAVALLQSRLDRLRTSFAHAVTAVVDLDDDGQSMLTAIAGTLDRRNVLTVITPDPDRPCIREARSKGARALTVDFARPETLAALPIWSRLDKLYLLSPDASANLSRLHLISERMAEVAGTRKRLPLIVRIDDPWQAAAWRAQQFGGTRTRWAADAVGKYEVTAGRLLDRITANSTVERILVAGGSRLTLALCTEMEQRRREREYYAPPGADPLPRLTLITKSAEEFTQDYQLACEQSGQPPDGRSVEAANTAPTVSALTALINKSGAAVTAVVVVDSHTTGPGTSLGTRLAARFPSTPIYAWDPNAEVTDDRPAVVGQLRTYRLTMDVPRGHAQDRWERAAQLIHDRYAAQSDRATPATRPWSDLDEFYRGSNRRQVQNALWMVEEIGGHTWNTFGIPPDGLTAASLRELPALEQLRRLGFSTAVALAMARAEHDDWCRYYRRAGWEYGAVRDDSRRVHDKLVDWAAVESDPAMLASALNSLATSLTQLRQLGYRSRPLEHSVGGSVAGSGGWQQFRRTGTVVAEQRDAAWTWTTRSGDTMAAGPGDWAVREPDGDRWWSVRDDMFRAGHEHVEGSLWRRTGFVRARQTHDSVVIDTLEGRALAAAGDWVVQSADGHSWPVGPDEFARRYQSA